MDILSIIWYNCTSRKYEQDEIMTSCFIVDISTNPLALVDLRQVIINNLQNRTGVTIGSDLFSHYTPQEKAAVSEVINALLHNDNRTLISQVRLLRQHPRSFALLTRFINAPGLYASADGSEIQSLPPNFFILHCEMGAESELEIKQMGFAANPHRFLQGPPTLANKVLEIVHLRAEFLSQIQALPNNYFDLLYIGGGHGGDFNMGNNMRTQMDGINENCWNQAFNLLKNKSSFSVGYIIAESCYSAAFAKEFQSILSNNGLCLSNLLECTPYEGLLESCAVRALSVTRNGVTQAPLLDPKLIIPSKAIAEIILKKCGFIGDKKELFINKLKEELDTLLPVIFNDPKKEFTEVTLAEQSQFIKDLLLFATRLEVTYDQLKAANTELSKVNSVDPKAFNLWDYIDPTNSLAPRNVSSINDMREAIYAKLIPTYEIIEARRIAAAYTHTVIAFTAQYMSQKTQPEKEQFLVIHGIDTKNLDSNFLLTEVMMLKTNNYNFESMQPLARVVGTPGETITSLITRLNNDFLDPTAKCFMTKEKAFLPLIRTAPGNAAADWRQRRDIQVRAIQEVYSDEEVSSLISPRLYAVMREFAIRTEIENRASCEDLVRAMA